MTGQRPSVDFNLYLITDRRQARYGELLEAVEQALQGGVRAVQLREKDMLSRELFELAVGMRRVTSAYGARLFINDRIDIAQAVDADGVHLGGDSIPLYNARMILGEQKLIGVSCHNQVSARNAQERGADFITFGPVFPTPSKARYGEPPGLEKLGLVTEALQIPVFGLGGIKLHNTPQVMGAGARGIALISAIIAADNPRHEAESILAAIAAACPDETKS